MFIFGTKKIEIFEYNHTTVVTKYKKFKNTGIKKGFLTFSPKRLSIAMARTILSKDPTYLDLFFQRWISFFGIQTIIKTHNSKLKLTMKFYEKFRDFSATGRTGELAQAINFIFAQDYLQYPIVIDFWGYIANILPPTIKYNKNLSAPDFILKKHGAQSISLLDSKGSNPDQNMKDLKKSLAEGLEQCDAGFAFASAKGIYGIGKKYASAVLFSSTNAWDTNIGFCDPPNIPNEYNINSLSLLRYHYASWFSMIGLFKFSRQLVNDKIDAPVVSPTLHYTNKDERFLMFDQTFIEFYQEDSVIHYLEYYRTKFGISEKIWDVLIGEKTEKEIKEIEFLSEEGIEIFTDGTIVLYGNYQQEGNCIYRYFV